MRAEVDKAADELKRDLDPLIRVGRALRIGRLEPVAGNVLRELARNQILGPGLFVIGSASMHLFEAAAGALLPRSIIEEGDLDLFSSAESRQEALEEVLPVIQRADKSFALHEASKTARNAAGFRVHAHPPLGAPCDRPAGRFRPAVVGVEGSDRHGSGLGRRDRPGRSSGRNDRNGSARVRDHEVRHRNLDPDRDGASARFAKDQAFATGLLVMRFNAKPFEDHQLAAFPAFAESIETGDPEAAEAAGRFFGP